MLFICKFIGKPHSITIKPGEVCINCNTSDVSFKQEQIITCAGVAFNFTTSLISYMFYSFVPISICLDFAICNLCIGIFNLLPVRTFDGGQLIYNALLRKYSLKATEIVTNILTVLIVIPLATAGFYILLISKFNYTLLIVAIYTVSIIITKEMR
ncbi:MAG: hypothetical protein IJ298_10740 [Ruminococcus sp.]|nr:hypothetical protein [Ruminococcus sp.]